MAKTDWNRDAGYVASLRFSGGTAVIYDRQNGGDWIDGDTRWVVAAYDELKRNIGLLDCSSLRIARELIKSTRAGEIDWLATQPGSET